MLYNKTMQIHIGTSGWMYKDWNGRFYPSEVKGTKQLPYFASQFKTVEINSTFYHMPRTETAENWYKNVPDDFLFSIKLNRYLTHTKRLTMDDDFRATLREFMGSVMCLKEKLGIILVQLPPSFKSDLLRLEQFLTEMKSYKIPLAIEFRHTSWFTPEVRELLRYYNAAQVVNDSPNRWPADKHVTADVAYIRFHGSTWLYRSSYTDKELEVWANFIVKTCASCAHVFAYFNNDHNAVAVNNARTLLEKVNDLNVHS